MLGTLLEATPEGQDWPSARDTRSLLAGGTSTRRADNQQLGPVTSLRQAVVLGLALYISWGAAQFFMTDPLTRAHGTPMLAGFLLAAATLAVWAGHRTLMVSTAAASLAVLAYYSDSYAATPLAHHHLPFQLTVNWFLPVAPLLLAMLALACLTRPAGRLPRSWLVLAGAPPLAMLVTRTLPVLLRPNPAPSMVWNLLPDVFLLLAIPALAWLATDARPALGVALAFLVSQAVPVAIAVQADITSRRPLANVLQGDSDVQQLVLAVVMTVAMAWMLRRRAWPRPH
jgi:hypothetical protein